MMRWTPCRTISSRSSRPSELAAGVFVHWVVFIGWLWFGLVLASPHCPPPSRPLNPQLWTIFRHSVSPEARLRRLKSLLKNPDRQRGEAFFHKVRRDERDGRDLRLRSNEALWKKGRRPLGIYFETPGEAVFFLSTKPKSDAGPGFQQALKAPGAADPNVHSFSLPQDQKAMPFFQKGYGLGVQLLWTWGATAMDWRGNCYGLGG